MKKLLIIFALFIFPSLVRAMDPPKEIPDWEMIKLLSHLAKSGDLESQLNLFAFYSSENTVDIAELLYWGKKIEQAYSQGELGTEHLITVYSTLGEIYFKQNNYKVALKYYYELVMLIKDNPEHNNTRFNTYLQIANVEFLLGENVKQALSICSQLLQHDDIAASLKMQVRFQLAAYLLQRGGRSNMTIALDHYEKILIYNIENEIDVSPFFYNNIACINEHLGNYTEAKIFYTKASEMGSDFSFCNLGYLYENGLGVEKNITKAEQFYSQGHQVRLEWENARKSMSEKTSNSLDALYDEKFGSHLKRASEEPNNLPCKRQRIGDYTKENNLLQKLDLIEQELNQNIPFAWDEVYPVLEDALMSTDDIISKKAYFLWTLYIKALENILINNVQYGPVIINQCYLALTIAKFSQNACVKNGAMWLLKAFYKLWDPLIADSCFFCCLELKDCCCLEQSNFLRSIGEQCYTCNSLVCRCNNYLITKIMNVLFSTNNGNS